MKTSPRCAASTDTAPPSSDNKISLAAQLVGAVLSFPPLW